VINGRKSQPNLYYAQTPVRRDNAFNVMTFSQEHIFQRHHQILARQSAILHINVKKYSPLVIFQQEVALYPSTAKI
jgi:hypothetical protein